MQFPFGKSDLPGAPCEVEAGPGLTCPHPVVCSQQCVCGTKVGLSSLRPRPAQCAFCLPQGQGPERLASGSDDFTLFLWSPAEDKKPHARMTGHQALINQVLFSPDSRIIASASFDKSIKLWDGRTGK